jgi:hypothetical protein
LSWSREPLLAAWIFLFSFKHSARACSPHQDTSSNVST